MIISVPMIIVLTYLLLLFFLLKAVYYVINLVINTWILSKYKIK